MKAGGDPEAVLEEVAGPSSPYSFGPYLETSGDGGFYAPRIRGRMAASE